MSRLAKKPVMIPAGAAVALEGSTVSVKGPKGELFVRVPATITVVISGTEVMVTSKNKEARDPAQEGTVWALIRNALEGVTNGFLKTLEIEGVGYKAAMEGLNLVLSLGFVNPVKVIPPPGISISVEKSIIKVAGVSKEVVGQVAAYIRAQKEPEPYKGKGIHYVGEVIRRKVGKKAGAAAA